MLNLSELKTLELFNEKVDRLKENSFVKHVISQKTGFTISWEKEKDLMIEKKFPEKESIEAFVLTLRYFIQDNEKISLRNIAKIYDKLPNGNQKKGLFKDALKNLNDFLDTPDKQLNIKENEKEWSKREIFDVIIYGELAHANEKKRQIYKRWMKKPVFGVIIENEFIIILDYIMRILMYLQENNDQLIIEETNFLDFNHLL